MRCCGSTCDLPLAIEQVSGGKLTGGGDVHGLVDEGEREKAVAIGPTFSTAANKSNDLLALAPAFFKVCAAIQTSEVMPVSLPSLYERNIWFGEKQTTVYNRREKSQFSVRQSLAAFAGSCSLLVDIYPFHSAPLKHP